MGPHHPALFDDAKDAVVGPSGEQNTLAPNMKPETLGSVPLAKTFFTKSKFYFVRKLVRGGILAVAANLHAKEPERKEFMSAQPSEEERKWRKVLVDASRPYNSASHFSLPS